MSEGPVVARSATSLPRRSEWALPRRTARAQRSGCTGTAVFHRPFDDENRPAAGPLPAAISRSATYAGHVLAYAAPGSAVHPAIRSSSRGHEDGTADPVDGRGSGQGGALPRENSSSREPYWPNGVGGEISRVCVDAVSRSR